MPSRKIRDIIRNQPILTADADLSVRVAAQQMAKARVGAIMITHDRQLVGIFTERDVLVRILAAGRDPDTTRLEEVMTQHPQTTHPEGCLGSALHLMYEGGFRHVPVVENGVPVGMISARDALGPELVAFEAELQQRDAITELL